MEPLLFLACYFAVVLAFVFILLFGQATFFLGTPVSFLHWLFINGIPAGLRQALSPSMQLCSELLGSGIVVERLHSDKRMSAHAIQKASKFFDSLATWKGWLI